MQIISRQKCILSYTQQIKSIKKELTDTHCNILLLIDYSIVKEDEKYRKDILPKMVSILKEMREKAEAAEVESDSSNMEDKSETTSENDDAIAGDDFFMEEWVALEYSVCSPIAWW